MKKLAVIVPCYNEDAVITKYYNETNKVLAEIIPTLPSQEEDGEESEVAG